MLDSRVWFDELAEGEKFSEGRVVKDVNFNYLVGPDRGVVVFNPDGALIERIETSGAVSSLCFGGDRNETLFVAEQSGVSTYKSSVRGLREVLPIMTLSEFPFMQNNNKRADR